MRGENARFGARGAPARGAINSFAEPRRPALPTRRSPCKTRAAWKICASSLWYTACTCQSNSREPHAKPPRKGLQPVEACSRNPDVEEATWLRNTQLRAGAFLNRDGKRWDTGNGVVNLRSHPTEG